MHTEEATPKLTQFTQRTMRASAVAAKLGVCEATIWRWLSLGEFPKQVVLSPGVSGWFEHEIDAWLAEKARARAA